VRGFNLPLVLKDSTEKVRIIPSEQWKSTALKSDEAKLFTKNAIERMYYIDAVRTKQ
jgi:hypothetical protein